MVKTFLHIFFLLLLFLIFNSWLTPGTLSSGDWLYKYHDSLSDIPLIPSVWDPLVGDRIGGNAAFLLGLNTYYIDTAFVFLNAMQLPWEIYERVIWYIPSILIAFYSSYFLFRKIFPNRNELYACFAGFIFATNTYFLMTVGGGQIAVGMAYSLAPFVINKFYTVLENIKDNKRKYFFTSSVIAGFVFSLQVLFDLRYAYITLAAVILLFIFSFVKNKSNALFLYVLCLPLSSAFLLHAFWISPFVASGQSPLQQLGDNYGTVESLQFFSFAKFENTFSLLHPNWPDNIFGKVGFMRPEFLLIPLMAFSVLLFPLPKTNKSKRAISYFALIAIIGTFLAKGTNDPLGQVYAWLFQTIPGFNMFRDPFKWYTLIALSYAMLIPYSLWSVLHFLKEHHWGRCTLRYITAIAWIVVYCFTLAPAFGGQLQGTFKPQELPSDYKKLEVFLSGQEEFFRTMWVPHPTNIAYVSYKHPRISATEFLKIHDRKKLLKNFDTHKNHNLLQTSGVRYVIVPFASRGEIFTEDRTYSEKEYKRTIESLRKISWLKEIPGFGRVVVFEIEGYKDHFWIENNTAATISYDMKHPTQYELSVQTVKKGDILIFNEGFDSHWKAKLENKELPSSQYKDRFNAFILPKEGSYSVNISYETQKYVQIGLLVSCAAFMTLIFIMLYKKYKR